MDCNASTSRIAEVLRGAFYWFTEENYIKVHPSDTEHMMRDEKLLKSVLASNGGNSNAAVFALVKRYLWKTLLDMNSMKYNVEQDKTYSKAVKPVGSDNRGFKVLFVDLSELGDLDGSKDIVEHMFYWVERLKRQGNKKITFVLHHGKSKFMGRNLHLVMLPLSTILRKYSSFDTSIFIFEDFLSNDYKTGCLIAEFKFVDKSSWSNHFKLDEKFDLSEGYLKLAQKKPDTVEKCDKSAAVLGEQCSEEIKNSESEVLENVGYKREERIKLKQILPRLHDVENQVFQLIRDVQELI